MSRRDRLRQGQEAKERVLSGAYTRRTPSTTTETSSRKSRLLSEGDRNARDLASANQLFGGPQEQLNSALQRIQPPSQRPHTGPIPSAPSFEQQVSSATRFEGTRERQKEERQKRAEDSWLSRTSRQIAPAIDRLVPNALTDLLPNPTEGSIADKAAKGTPIIEQVGQGIRATEIPGVTTNNAVTNFLRGAGDTATFGLAPYLDRTMGLPERAEGATETGAGRAGQIAGGIVLPAGRAVQGASAVSNIGRAAKAGALIGAGTEIGEQLTNRNDQTALQRLGDIGLSTALGGAGGTAGELLGAAGRSLQSSRKAALQSALRGVDAIETAATGKGLAKIDEGISNQRGLPTVIAEQAATAEPMKGNWFTSVFGNKGLGIAATRSKSGRNLATTEGQIVDNPLKRDAQGLKDQTAATVRAIRQDYEDFTAPLKYTGRDTYDIAQDARRANNLANTSITDKFVDLEGNVIGQSLKDIGNKVARGEGNAFEDYLILRHAKTRMARGERVYDPNIKSAPKTPDEVQLRIDELNKRYPQFAGIAKEWDDYNRNMRNLWVNEGLITKAQSEAMEAANPNYASMRRQFSLSEKYANPFGSNAKGFSGQKAPIKEVSPTGSVRKIVSPFRSAMEQTGATYTAALRNRVMQNLYAKAKSDPESLKGIVEIVPDTAEATQKSLKEINDILNTDGVEGLVEKLDDEFIGFKKAGQKGSRTDNIVTAMINGNPVKMRVENPEIFKALVGLGPEESNIALDFIGALSNATKYGATGALAPLFAARSLTTDIASAMIQSKQPLMHVVDLVHAGISSIANKLPKGTPGFEALRELAQDFSRTGGEYSAYLKGDRQLNNAVGDVLIQPFLSPKGVARTAGKVVSSPFKVLNSISDIAENVNRMAAYQGALRRQGNQRTPEAIRNAMRESQEITTNFSRQGSKSRSIEKFVPYSNAAVQGIRRFAKQWKENPVRTAALVGSAVIAPKIYEYSMFSDDPDYQKIPAREKYRNLIVKKNEDGTFVKVPMPAEYNALGAATVDFLTAYKDGDPVNWRQSADAIVNAYTPPFVSGALQGVTQGGGFEQSIGGMVNSTSLAPAAAIFGNQSFTGAPIVPERLSGASPTQQYDETTSEVGKKVGQFIVMSPKKVDYLLRAYGGDPARILLPLTSKVGAGTTKNTLLKTFITDPVFTNTLSTDFYDMKEKITQAEADNKINGVPFPSWYSESIADIPTSQKKGSVSKRLSDLSTQKREVQGDNALSAEQKSQKLRDVQAQMNEIYLDAITRMIESGVPTGR